MLLFLEICVRVLIHVCVVGSSVLKTKSNRSIRSIEPLTGDLSSPYLILFDRDLFIDSIVKP